MLEPDIFNEINKSIFVVTKMTTCKEDQGLIMQTKNSCSISVTLDARGPNNAIRVFGNTLMAHDLDEIAKFNKLTVTKYGIAIITFDLFDDEKEEESFEEEGMP